MVPFAIGFDPLRLLTQRMYAPNLGQGTATTFELSTSREPADNIFTSQALLNLIKRGKGFKKESGGSVIEEPIEYTENTTFRSYSELETLDTTRVDVFDAARFEWKQPVCGTIVFSELEKLKCAGDSAKLDLVARKVDNAKNSAMAVLNRMMYADGTGNGGKDCLGLAVLVSSTPTTGTVGSIDRATFAFWRNRQTAGTLSATPFDNLRGAMRTIYNNCSKGAAAEHPTDFIFHQTPFQGYEGTLTTNERFTSKDSGDGGFKNEVLKFKGSKVTFDEDAPSGTGYALNDRNLFFRYLAWMKAFPAVDPANQLGEIVKIMTAGQMTINNPRRLGVITAIT
jgi:hypothetical protein